ncbi:hypothetical protein GLOTRDRAFT_70569 [Gloeophyllum trabeum ATCC 11539]|uniref:DUF7719 domain-containing protein n=1 Tax=Gloeophyllum trabeum (strain ATCC 11539 / FP-39264 / Madison 617) TaxID=670483 RepID=S7QIU8_GLOTA|nr:uncharacterized protein GLOTRDRAFT_70569 [Gloeophyllum trabeum ATCC 11539]EPQ59277.1 hypothetical protein GLOTRDRAFT_70569 [Gloeophyllum trabeum ATCC 11539]
MTKNRKANKSHKPNEQRLEISEEEQWRIINQSGILRQVDAAAKATVTNASSEEEPISLAEEIFNSLVFITPCSFLLLMMEILIHYQYGKHPTFDDLARRMISGVPILSIFVFYTVRHKQDRRVQFLLFLLSLATGMRLIWLVNRGSWLTNMRQCPPLATAWIYAVVQLDLGPATLSLVIVFSWVWWAGLKLTF